MIPMDDIRPDPITESLQQIEGQHVVLDKLSQEIATGRVKCVMAQILYEDNTSYTLNSGGTMVEQVGLLESMKFDLLMGTRSVANKWEEDETDDQE